MINYLLENNPLNKINNNNNKKNTNFNFLKKNGYKINNPLKQILNLFYPLRNQIQILNKIFKQKKRVFTISNNSSKMLYPIKEITVRLIQNIIQIPEFLKKNLCKGIIQSMIYKTAIFSPALDYIQHRLIILKLKEIKEFRQININFYNNNYSSSNRECIFMKAGIISEQKKRLNSWHNVCFQ